jgi:hypothetical protein
MSIPSSLPEIRFCLSGGQTWIFFILKLEDATTTYYESAIRRLPLRDIVQLVREWVGSSTVAHISSMDNVDFLAEPRGD